MRIVVDSRMREIEKDYLARFGELVEVLPQDCVYEEISAHPDIFFCKLNDTVFRAPNLEMNVGIVGGESVGYEYPEDVRYNVCQIGEFVVHNFEFTDSKLLEFIDEHGLKRISVNQGYSNCSVCVVSEKACVTSDVGICKALKLVDIDCLLLDSNCIKLLNKNGLETKMRGFIGGASCVIGDEFILFGDSERLDNKFELLDFLDGYGLRLKDFKGLDIYDYGGIVVL